jgi:general secretion pathway protein G
MVGAHDSADRSCAFHPKVAAALIPPSKLREPWQARRLPLRARISRGFTLIELMIVVAIIVILIGIAAGMYQRSVQRAKEATLKSDLKVMRQAIDNYTLDKEAAPQSLEDLTNSQSQYLREIPTDPMTNAKDWHADFGDTVMSPDQSATGIVDVHSNSDKISPFEGTPYNSW